MQHLLFANNLFYMKLNSFSKQSINQIAATQKAIN